MKFLHNFANFHEDSQNFEKIADFQKVSKFLQFFKGIFKRISIDDSLIKQDEKEILEDLIVAAINDAKEKGEVAAQEEMKSLTGDLPLPPGMKLPF